MHECGVPGGALNQNSAGYLRHCRFGVLPHARKNSHGRTRNRTRDLMISSQMYWPPSHEAGHSHRMYPITYITMHSVVAIPYVKKANK
jgi:hypothetical protein